MKNITKNNALIAEFIGLERVMEFDDGWFYYIDNIYYNPQWKMITDVEYCSSDELPYHLSWDWLMPVVEKIMKFGNVTITEGDCEISTLKEDNYDFLSTYNIQENKYSTIEATYKAVIEFIKWYNKHSKK